MLNCEPPEMDDPVKAKSEGVSAQEEPELEVLEHDREAEQVC